jgi:hypothetical protein
MNESSSTEKWLYPLQETIPVFNVGTEEKYVGI